MVDPQQPQPGPELAKHAGATAIWILGVFSVLAALIGSTWAPFPSVPGIAKGHGPGGLGMSEAALSWQQNANNMAQAVLTIPCAWLLSRTGGLRLCVVVSTVAVVLQCVGFAAVTSQWVAAPTAIAAAVFGGLAAALTQGAASQLSATWFEPSARGRATAMVYCATYFGQCLSYLLFTGAIRHLTGLRVLMDTEVALAVLLLLATAAHFPAAPRHAAIRPVTKILDDEDGEWSVRAPLLAGDPSAAADDDDDDDDDTEANAEAATLSKQDEDERPSLIDGIRACAKKPTVPLLVVAGGVVSGAYTSWATLLPVMVQGLGESVVCNGTALATHPEVPADHPMLDSQDGDMMAFVTTLAYALGGYFSGEMADRYFIGRLKRLLQMWLVLAVLVYTALALALPIGRYQAALTLECDGRAIDRVIIAGAALAGSIVGSIMPPLLEMLAEVSYPAMEGVTANAVLLVMQIGCLPLPFLVPALARPAEQLQAANWAMLGLCAAALALVTLAREEYLRPKAAKEDYLRPKAEIAAAKDTHLSPPLADYASADAETHAEAHAETHAEAHVEVDAEMGATKVQERSVSQADSESQEPPRKLSGVCEAPSETGTL